jgi:hypothetical protein
MPSVPGRSSGRLVSKENVDEVEGFLTKNDNLLVLKKNGFQYFQERLELTCVEPTLRVGSYLS